MYVVFDAQTTAIVANYHARGWAERKANQLNKDKPGQYLFSSREFYNEHVVKDIQVRSLMTGELVTIASNTPWSCRPDSESYWAN